MDLAKSKNDVPIRLTEERWFQMKDMAVVEVTKVLNLVPELWEVTYPRIWATYDQEADVLYVNFKKPSHADDSELTDDDRIIRYEKGDIMGITVLNASRRRDRYGRGA